MGVDRLAKVCQTITIKKGSATTFLLVEEERVNSEMAEITFFPVLHASNIYDIITSLHSLSFSFSFLTQLINV